MSRNQAGNVAMGALLLVLLVAPVQVWGAGPGASGLEMAAKESRTGWLHITWGDGRSGPSDTRMLFQLVDDEGRTTDLEIKNEVLERYGGVLALDRNRLSVAGDQLSGSGEGSPLLQVDSISPKEGAAPLAGGASDASADSPLAGPQPWVNLLCKFSGNSSEPRALSYFQGLFGSSRPGLNHYWEENSYSAINISGTITEGWYTLPHAASYYRSQGDMLDQLFDDCTNAADGDVNFTQYVGINMMFNDELDGYAWGGSQWASLDGESGFWYVTWEPPWGYQNQTVLAHEMGHGFGLPHSSGNYGATYDNVWDVMSDNWTYCYLSADPTYGCLAQHTISFHKALLDWIPEAQKFTADPGQHTITLERLALPSSSNYRMAVIPVDGSNEHYYTVEARHRDGYDAKLPAEAVIIHEVVTTRTRPARVIDIDGNGDTGDAGAQWIVGETFSDAANEISVSIDSATSTGFVVTINLGGTPPTPTPTPTPAPTGDRQPPPSDFDADLDTDIGVFRPSDSTWYIDGQFSTRYGKLGDIPVAADYDGDGRTEMAVFRPSQGRWYIHGVSEHYWGLQGDVPLPCDYDGDGSADLAVYRPSQGRWYVKDQFSAYFGLPGDMPVPGDYDGDGVCDLAVYRPSEGRWYVRDVTTRYWGLPGDIPVPGDYDGDGDTDLAVYRPAQGKWYIRDIYASYWGSSGDIPVPGDYDGDGSYDLAVYRPAEGRWYVKDQIARYWGLAGDFPVMVRDTNGDGDPYY